MKMVKPNYNQYKASTPANKVFSRYIQLYMIWVVPGVWTCVITFDILAGPIYCVQCDDEARCEELPWEDLSGELELVDQANNS